MSRLNYHHLYYFWTVARLRGIGAAARELGLAQSTLSTQLAQLEKKCGKRLLVRGPWGARLTPEGDGVLLHCRRIFEAGAQLEAEISAGLEATPRTLNIGAHGAVPRTAVMRVIETAQSADPGLNVVVTTGTPEGIAERLESRVLDLAVATLDLSLRLGRDFRGKAVGEIPLVFASAPSVSTKAGRFPQGLSRVPMLLRGPDNPVTKQVEQFLRERGATPPIAAQADDAELLRSLALAGHGVAALELPSVRADLAAGALVCLHARPSGLRETVWLVAARAEGERPWIGKAMGALWGRFSLGRDLVSDAR